MTEAVNALAALGSLAASRGQFRRRRWSVAVAMVGRRLAFCIRLKSRADATQEEYNLLLTRYGLPVGWPVGLTDPFAADAGIQRQ